MNPRIKTILTRSIGIAFLLIILAVFMDLIDYFSSRFYNINSLLQTVPIGTSYAQPSEDPLQNWKNIFHDHADLINRGLSVEITPISSILTFNITVAKGHPLIESVVNNGLLNRKAQLIYILFGDVKGSFGSLEEKYFSPESWTIEPKDGIFKLTLTAKIPSDNDGFFYINQYDERGQITDNFSSSIDFNLSWKDVKLTKLYPVPDLSQDQKAEIKTDETTNTLFYPISLSYEVDSNQAQAPVNKSPAGQSFLSILDKKVKENGFITSIITGILEIIALILGFFIYRKYETSIESRIPRMLIKVFSGLIIFHFSVLVLSSSGSLLPDSVTQWLSQRFSELIYPIYPFSSNYIFGNGLWYFVPVAAGVIIPEYFRGSITTDPRKLRPFWNFLSALFYMGIIGLVIFDIYMIFQGISTGNQKVQTWIVSSLGLCIILLLIIPIISSLYYRIFNRKIKFATLTLALFLIPFLRILDALTWPLANDRWIIWGVIATLFSFILLYSYIKFISHTLSESSFQPPAWIKWPGFFVLLLFSIPMNTLVNAPANLSSGSPFVDFCYRLDDLIRYVWLGGIIWILYKEGNTKIEISSPIREIGILTMAALFFLPTVNWIFIPLRFLFGLIMFHVAINPISYWHGWGSILEEIGPFKKIVLKKLWIIRTAEMGFRSLRAKLADQFSKGEIKMDAYLTNLDDAEKELVKLKSDLVIEGKNAEEISLAFGPHASAWQNALNGFLWSIIFALPWIILSLKNLLTDSIDNGSYPLWTLLLSLLTTIISWGGMGFFMGYFYPYIKGKNGLQKGFYFFTVFLIALLPMMAIRNSTPGGWQTSLFWLLQIFIECMLLGLVGFDYMTLRKNQMSLQILFDVYGLPVLGISITSILAAIGGVLFTLLSSKTMDLVNIAFNYILPSIPSVTK